MATGTQLEKSTPGASGTVPLGAGLSALWSRGRVQWASMQPAQRSWAMVSAVLLVALAGFLLWYTLRADWRTLYANLDPEDARQMSVILTQAQIPFDVSANGAGIRVPAAQIGRAHV